jgi:hypothetical protein
MTLSATISDVSLDTVPVLVASGLQAAFDVHLFAFRQVVGKVLRPPQHDVVPVGFFFPFVGLAILPAAAGSHAELCDGYTAWGEIGLGIPAEMAEHNYFVHTSHTNLLFCGGFDGALQEPEAWKADRTPEPLLLPAKESIRLEGYGFYCSILKSHFAQYCNSIQEDCCRPAKLFRSTRVSAKNLRAAKIEVMAN